MNTETLRQIFKSPFDYTTYSCEIVHRLFGCHDVASRPEWLDTNAEGDQSFFIGQMDDADHRLLGFFYTRVAEGGDVRRKRVGLRKLISPYLKYDVDGAIAVFDDGRHWRLSYICDLKEGSTSAKRFSYILGDENGQYKTPLERLEKVARLNGRLTLSDLRESFSVDALSDEFFDEYHLHYDRIVANLTQSYRRDVPWRVSADGTSDTRLHDYVKKMMGRIVFLHFLQKKGWLNGNPTFLRDLFCSSPHQADFLEQVLEPLFFGIFNTEPEQREKLFADEQWDQGLLKQWERLPYLNGGLFERDEVDKMNIKLPASLFNDLFTFLASYNFTVDENDPDDAEIGVDPEMLGKIFESLLEDNKAKGAFYTPKEIVRYMCKESLIAYLGAICFPADEKNTNCEDVVGSKIRTFVETHEFPGELEPYREILDRALREVKICDPAIGSGAFPMGLLNELWRCREAISLSPVVETQYFASPSMDPSSSTQSRAALKREIIENNIYGVDIERGAIDIARLRFWLSIVVDSEKPQALPNFDYKFMQGNSLIESFEGVDLSRMMSSDGQHSSLGKGRQKAGANQLGIEFVSTDTKRNLQLMLREYFSLTDHVKKAEARCEINDSVKSYIRHQDLRPEAVARLAALDPSANQEFFLWHTWFKDIFDKGGFDIVVGNPPYISAVEMARTEYEKSIYKKNYPQATGAYDIYVLFLLRGLMLTKNVFFWIIPNKFLIADYAKKTKELLEQNGLYSSVDVSVFKVFKNASVYPIILCGSRTSDKEFCKYTLDKYEDLLFNKARPIKELGTSLTIKDCRIEVCSGATGFEAQIIKEYVVDGERVNVIPFTVSGNIDRYQFNNIDVRYMKSRYHNAYIRTDCNVADSKLRMWMSPKIVIAGMTKVIEATYVETPLALGVGAYAITAFNNYSPYYITGLLNSKYTSYYLRNKFKDKHLAGGYLAINKSTIEQLPFVKADDATQGVISSNAKKIIELKKNNPNADTSALEREIDGLVYGLYGLTEEDIATIESCYT
ncbi:MAG: Eco57I restriction-modification methylase domain-containing protein [Bacteroidales bacterium]|nr:Eco57I restriction-modification methylase domain-containing protein [Bacteroidales bacterium]MBQ5993759.1 Eco57I restriction-modification methylase domain-containing protein [Bacteroidales bacterium]